MCPQVIDTIAQSSKHQQTVLGCLVTVFVVAWIQNMSKLSQNQHKGGQPKLGRVREAPAVLVALLK